MKAYKAFEKIEGSKTSGKCIDFIYEEGETYVKNEKPVLCEVGFHFCKDLVFTLRYYPVINNITENIYAEVEILGDVIFEDVNEHKGVTNKIKIVRFLSDDEVTDIVNRDGNSGIYNSGDGNSGDCNSGDCNSGDRNSGDYNSGDGNSGDYNSGDRNSGSYNSGNVNSGDYNTGDRNSGDYNTGDRNSGNYNKGDYNSGDWNTGYFNSNTPSTIRVFNKECSIEDWNNATKPYFIYFDIIEGKSYKECFIESYNKATLEDKKLVLNLPNFDKDIFFEITGIDVSDIM